MRDQDQRMKFKGMIYNSTRLSMLPFAQLTTPVTFCQSHEQCFWPACFSGRAKLRVEELERLLEIAKKNFVQLGGTLSEDRRRIREMRDKDQWVHDISGLGF